METRIFNRRVRVMSTDGSRSETFDAGERVKNVQKMGKRVMFEPVRTHRIAGTYALDWGEFERNTIIVQQATA